MQSKIRVLNEHTINKIAAGEVIENPGSVIKELVENSLDARADTITIEIQQGGRELIRVSDNGSGMSPDDAVLCLERHATSKIHEVEDIQDLSTMGFRGEAIPSIASISKFSLLTCGESGKATLVLVDGGRLISASPAARAKGTTIEVKSLFFNVPVRRKFQKSPTYDTQAIIKMISLLALSHPTIQFELISDQKSILKTGPAENLKKRIEEILGKEYTKGLSPVELEVEPYRLSGFIGLPEYHKPNRSHQYLFINQRAVSSPMISAVIREAYGPMLPSQRFPSFVLHLQLPGHLVDVNVHPQKKEVRLRQEQQLKEILIKAVQKALQRNQSSLPSLPPSFSFPENEEYIPASFSFPKKSIVEEEKWEFKSNFEPLPVRTFEKRETEVQMPLFALPNENPKVLLTFKGFVLIDSVSAKLSGLTKDVVGGLCLVDQKAAYARVYYEKLLNRSSSERELQTLLIPVQLEFSVPEARLLRLHLEQLNQMGFAIREFGDHTFLIDAYPNFVRKDDLANCLNQIVHELLEAQETRKLEQIREEKLALAACRVVISGNKRLSLDEASGLIDQLFSCENPFQCPFGKPVVVYWSPERLPELFKS